jgi:hypothetical protein
MNAITLQIVEPLMRDKIVEKGTDFRAGRPRSGLGEAVEQLNMLGNDALVECLEPGQIG